jgi:TonB-dependent starch-binding outer membrane protein SusC
MKKSLLVLSLLCSLAFASRAQTRPISGRVTSNEDAQPLPGVSVVVKGTTTGTATDADGRYQLSVGSDAVLVFSFIGYLNEERPVNNQTTLDVKLMSDIKALSEVVVVGYGTVRKSDLTGSVSSVKGQDLTAIPVTNALEVLQGKVAGLDLTRSSGQAGAGLNFSIRGQRSLAAASAPLVIVDGVPYTDPFDNNPRPLDINPNDIQSMEVLKDAASTAIYGSRGANGVILITTKRGTSGQPKISFNSYYGIQSLTGYADIMTGPEFVALRRESRRTAGLWSSEADDSKIFDPVQLANYQNGIWTDWAKELLGTGSQQNYQIGISGGSEKTTYYFSLEYFNEKGLLKNDQLKRYSGRLMLEQRLAKPLKVGVNMLYTLKDNDRRTNPLNQANKFIPLSRPYDDNGNFLPAPAGEGQNAISPIADEQPGAFVNNVMDRRLFSSLFVDLQVLKNLSFRSTLGVDLINNRNGFFANTNTIDAGYQGLSIARDSLGLTTQLNWENVVNYNQTLGVHDFQITAGTTTLTTRNEGYKAEGRDLISPTFLYHNLRGTQSSKNVESNLRETALASFFGRVNYKLMDKYLLTLTMRADGSSVLAKGKKWAYFPAAALAWKVKEEGFLREVDFMNEMKIRASYGISGSSAVAPYQTTGGLGGSTYVFDRGASELPAYGYYPSILEAPGLTWETTATTNFGLDFGFFNNRISGTIDLYQQDTDGLLLLRQIPPTSGFSTIWDNIGKTRNRGIEVLLSTVNMNTGGGFRWNTDFTFTSNQERITELPTGNRDLVNQWFVGQPGRVWYDYEKTGIWQLGEEAAAAENQQKPGDIRVKDQDGDGKITVEDRIVLGTPRPKWSLGVNNRVSFKGFDLTVFVFARIGQMINSEAAGSYKIDASENGTMVDYWTPENPTNAYPRPDSRTNRTTARYYSTLRYMDGSFVKIRDITLGYSLPATVAGKIALSRLRVYATAKNYFVFSNMNPYDPERGGALDFPMTKQLVLGLNAEF